MQHRTFTLRARPALHSLLAAAWIAVSPAVPAVETLELVIGDVEGAGWSASSVNIALVVGAERPVARLSASRVTFPEPLGSLRDVNITCRDPVVEERVFACKGADVRGNLGPLGPQSLRADVTYDAGALSFAIAGLRIAGGQASARGSWQERGWRTTVDIKSADLTALRRFAATYVALPASLGMEGTVPAMRLELRGADSLQEAKVDATLASLAVANETGTVATDQLALQLQLRARPEGPDWAIEADLRSQAGQAYVDPIFVDFGTNPSSTSFSGRWRGETSTLELAQMRFDAAGIASGNATGILDFAGETPLKSLQLHVEKLQFPGAYATLFRPLLGGTLLKDLETSGQVTGSVSLTDGAPSRLGLQLAGLTAVSADKRFAMRGLNGHVQWTTREELPSDLRWTGAQVFGISGGPANLRFAAWGSNFRVLEPSDLPIFDGGLSIRTLDVREVGKPSMALRFEADLRPISMAKLSTAFGWPEFAGTLSGRIPQVSLDNNVLSVGGDLEAQAFGGNIVVNGLQLRDPLGKYPRLSANARLRNLDLEAVTGTFEFGTITGRLDGDVRNLELFRWAPVRFDARLHTPRNDRSRRIISQRAVNNLSNIGGGGGGVTAALSSGFLRFFQNFRYERIGLSCRLEREVCYMDGVEPAGTPLRYYIVKGAGIPRIDIIGNAHLVSWGHLVSQLQAIQSGGGPRVGGPPSK
jgi:hypothetical protein